MRKIYGVNASPFVRKVRVALAEKGLDYEMEPVMPFGQSEEYMKISPLGKIPTYQEDDFIVPDSSVIIHYLEQTNPEPPLYPADPRECARALFLEEYGDTALVNAAAAVFVQRVVNPKIKGEPTDEDAVKKTLEEDLPPLFDYLESQLTEGASTILASGFTVADIAIGSPFVNLSHGGEQIDAGRWPKLAKYVDGLFERASFKSLIEEEREFFAAA